VVKHAVVSSEDTHATAAFIRSESIRTPAAPGPQLFLPKLGPFLLAKEMFRTNRTTNSEFAGNLQLV
jgi:hypothetical protein